MGISVQFPILRLTKRERSTPRPNGIIEKDPRVIDARYFIQLNPFHTRKILNNKEAIVPLEAL
jgi:hypothetical protein